MTDGVIAACGNQDGNLQVPNGAPPNQWIALWGNIAIHGTSDINSAPGPAWLRATDPDREFGAVRIDDDRYRFNGQPAGGIGGRA